MAATTIIPEKSKRMKFYVMGVRLLCLSIDFSVCACEGQTRELPAVGCLSQRVEQRYLFQAYVVSY
jgi:hypothetical protein